MPPNKISLLDSYEILLKEYFDINLKNEHQHPTKISLLLNLIEIRLSGMETRIEKLEGREVHAFKFPTG